MKSVTDIELMTHRVLKSSMVKKKIDRVGGYVQGVMRLMREPKLRNIIQFSTSVFKESEPFVKDPSSWNAARAAFGVLQRYIENSETWPDTFFEGPGWRRLSEFRIAMFIHESLSHGESFPNVIKTADDSNAIYIHDFENFRVGYSFNMKHGVTSGDVYFSGDEEAARDELNEMVWKLVDSSSSLLRLGNVVAGDRRLSLEKDNATEALSSQRASDYADYLCRCIDAGVNRSVMMYGPPGTGKSSMAREIVKKLGFKSLRIRVEDIQYIENSTVMDIFEIVRPDVVIFDDFDRADRQTKLLEMLESMKKIKVVIATVNDRKNLDQAILRPGRFDEMLLVDKMEEPVIRHILGEACADLFEIVKSWPIAYINEIVQRRRFMSPEEAQTSVEELVMRVNEVTHDIHSSKEKDNIELSFVKSFAKKNGVKLDDDDDDDDAEVDNKSPLAVVQR